MMEETSYAQDEFTLNDNIVIYDTIKNVQELVDNLVDDFSMGKI